MDPSDLPFVRTGPRCVCGDRRDQHVGKDPLIPAFTVQDTLCQVPGCTGCPYGYRPVTPIDKTAEAKVRQEILDAEILVRQRRKVFTGGALIVLVASLALAQVFEPLRDLIVAVSMKALLLWTAWLTTVTVRDRTLSAIFRVGSVLSLVAITFIVGAMQFGLGRFLAVPIAIFVLATIVVLGWDAHRTTAVTSKLPEQMEEVMRGERLLAQAMALFAVLPLTVARHEKVSSV